MNTLKKSSNDFINDNNLFIDDNFKDLVPFIKNSYPKRILDLDSECSIKSLIEKLGGEDIVRSKYTVSPSNIVSQLRDIKSEDLLKNKYWNIYFFIGRKGQLVVAFSRFLPNSTKFALYGEEYSSNNREFNAGCRVFGN